MRLLASTKTELIADVPRYRAAFALLAEEREALPKEQLTKVNIAVPSTVILLQRRFDRIRALRPRIAREAPHFDLERFDKFETYVLALGHAHTRYMAASAPCKDYPALVAQAVRVRQVLLADVVALVTRELVGGDRLVNLKGNKSHRSTAYDLFLLAEVLRENWPAIQGKTALDLKQLNEAEALADKLSLALSEREETPQSYRLAHDAWVRSFVLFLNAYKDVRRVVQFLDPDHLEDIIPKIYIGRGPGKKHKKQKAAESASAANTAPATTPVEQPAAVVPQPPAPPSTHGLN